MVPARPDSGVLRRAVEAALDCADSVWYCHTLKSDVCGCTLGGHEERSAVAGAVRAAADMAQQVVARYGLLSPQQLAAAMCIKTVHAAEELRHPYLYLGMYQPGTRTITLNDNAIARVQQFIAANGLGDVTPPDDIIGIAMFHEIFHALEEETPGIYTRSRMLRRKALGVLPYRRGLNGVSEVGALHFSKCLAGISYSPCIYERYLLLALGQLSIDFLPPNV